MLYAVPTLPAGKDVVVMASAAFTVMLKPAVVDCCGELESTTLTVKEDVPVEVGLPEICPVLVFSVRPLGKLPTLTLQIYGCVPPIAARGLE